MSVVKQKYTSRFVVLVLFMVSAVITPIFNSESATAIKCDYAFLEKNIPGLYDPCQAVCSTNSTNDSSLTGSDNSEKIWKFFIEKGLTPEQTAGVMGNLSHESQLQTAQIKKDVFGIAGWTGNELINLNKAAQSEGKDVFDLEFQLNYLYASLNARSINRKEYAAASYSSEWNGLTQQKTTNDALVFFHHELEASFLLDFDEPANSTKHKAALALTTRDYDTSTAAVIGERGGTATVSGLDPNGNEGALYFMNTYSTGAEDISCSTSKAVHPIADGDIVWEGYGGPRPDAGALFCGGMKWHNGYDLNGQENVTPVLAAMSGSVTSIDYDIGYLNTVSITHLDGFRIRYMHMNDGHIKVKVGDIVTPGQAIGEVGSGNGNYGVHLHVEIDVAGNTNPQVAALHVNNCGISSVNPNLFFRLFGVDLCPTDKCDNPTIEL